MVKQYFLLDSVKDTELRILFAKRVLEEGWSKNINTESVENKIVNYEKHLLKLSNDQRKEIFNDLLILSFINSN